MLLLTMLQAQRQELTKARSCQFFTKQKQALCILYLLRTRPSMCIYPKAKRRVQYPVLSPQDVLTPSLSGDRGRRKND